jgi:hypothetical protein
MRRFFRGAINRFYLPRFVFRTMLGQPSRNLRRKLRVALRLCLGQGTLRRLGRCRLSPQCHVPGHQWLVGHEQMGTRTQRDF